MAYLLKVLAFVLVLFASPVFAGYAQLKPPPGWSQGMGAAVPGQAGVFKFGEAANGAVFKGTTVLTNSALNVAGQLVTVPVSMRVAANAASVAATWSFGNPYALVVGTAAVLTYNWLKENGLEVKNGQWMKKVASDPCAGAAPNNPPWVYTFRDMSPSTGGFYCNYTSMLYGSPGNVRSVFVSGSPADPSFVPVGDPEFHSIMDPKPLPVGVPKELPDVQWPVELPVINPKLNPGVDPLPVPSPALQPQPLRVPVGEPQPVPNSNPQKWDQPVVDIVPAPVPESPWRVDLQPKRIESPTPDGIKNPEPVPVLDPDPETGVTPTDPNVKPEPTPGLCDEYPDIVACQKLGEVEAKDLKNKNVPLKIDKDSGWEMASASCPAPKVVNLSGKPYSFEIKPLCDFASGIKPLVVGFAWITAILGFIGLSRKGD